MGKKSKRQRGGGNNNSSSGTSHSNNNGHQQQQQQQQNKKQQFTAPSDAAAKTITTDDLETKENLRFEDPFVDELIQEDVVVNNDDDDDDDDDGMEDDEADEISKPTNKRVNITAGVGDNVEVIQSWHPLMGHKTGDDGKEMELEMDPTAYKMYQTISPEWPCLTFDILRDQLGDNRQRFPHTLQAVIGTQADDPNANQITVLKLSDLSKLPQDEDNEEDILGDEYGKDDGSDDDDDDSDSDEDDKNYDLDPILEHYSLPHYGGVNRLRVIPSSSSDQQQYQQNIVATWSDVGRVNLYDIQELRARFDVSEGRGGGRSNNDNNNNRNTNNNGPFFSYDGHTTEGFAIDWSHVNRGALATGDNDGNIHLWSKSDEGGSSYTVTPSYETPGGCSVEDLQWSPTESTVVCAAESDGHVAVYDTRAPHRAMLRPHIHPNTDVNVIGWNKLVSNLLATGADDGTLCVWDLRHFGGGGGGGNKKSTVPKPLARFTCHQTPVTSVEWHPTDESMLAISDEVGVYIYDLSVEEDVPSQQQQQEQPSSEMEQLVADIPAQLLFCHSGSKQFKECHWHPQISSCVMTTAYSGFSIFIPSNL